MHDLRTLRRSKSLFWIHFLHPQLAADVVDELYVQRLDQLAQEGTLSEKSPGKLVLALELLDGLANFVSDVLGPLTKQARSSENLPMSKTRKVSTSVRGRVGDDIRE
jgi:hypothetical protein